MNQHRALSFRLLVLVGIALFGEAWLLNRSQFRIRSISSFPRISNKQSRCHSVKKHFQMGVGVSGKYLDSIKDSRNLDENVGAGGLRHRNPRRRLIRWTLAIVIGSLLVLTLGRAAATAASTLPGGIQASEMTANMAVSTTPSAAATSSTSGSLFRGLAGPLSSSLWELRLSLRLVFAALTGAAVGKERSGLKYHPAGVRTMSLVALGAALFTICSLHGFEGTHYDTSRMASNVASGVGFIGAGVIYHEQSTDRVHGLTTAAAIWISAAVGVSCGTGLFVVASMSTALTLAILRVGGELKFRRKDVRAKSRKRYAERQKNSLQSTTQFTPNDVPQYFSEHKSQTLTVNSTYWRDYDDDDDESFSEHRSRSVPVNSSYWRGYDDDDDDDDQAEAEGKELIYKDRTDEYWKGGGHSKIP